MSRLPVVAIIGRPNTGKSTLFNALTGTRKAIVNDLPGTTRDHVAVTVEGEEVDYLLLDTGGIGGGSKDKELEKDVSAQTLVALKSADLIVFTLNAREPLTGSDQTVIDLLRRSRKRHVPVIIVATKCDKPGAQEEAVPEYTGLGLTKDVLAVSAVHRMGIGELEELILERLKELHFKKESPAPGTAVATAVPRIAVIGRPNVGKSSLLNALMSDVMREKSPRIVSDIPGTTRDASDTLISAHGKPYLFVDTAGMRRKARIEGDIESLSMIKSIQAVEESDVVILVMDAGETTSHQDKYIAGMAIERGKGLILLVNKADLLKPEEKKERAEELVGAMNFCRFAPMLMASAKTRDGLLKLFPLIDSVYRNRLRRIPMKDLRNWFEKSILGVPARSLSTAKHITQAADPPPTFVLFVRHPRTVQDSQLRYLENSIRALFSFEGTPIRWVLKKTGGRE